MTRQFRPDIEGMRAVAVAMVVLYHVGVPGFSGGYVGVDVFFVLSGFLITRLLVDQLESTGRLRIGEFYARRIRRLLPASVLVILATLVLSMLVLSPLQNIELRREAVATSAYLSNVHFAWAGIDYLQVEVGASPFQHYWSLAVEEQFYLGWPLLLLAVAVTARKLRWGLRPTLLAVMAVVLTVSLGLSIFLTDWRQPWGFFLLPARAWELTAGGMLATVSHRLPAVGRYWRATAVVPWVGVALLVWSVMGFDSQTSFPGWVAVVPVVGTLLILATGTQRGAIQGFLSNPGCQYVGQRSYAIYLWHWPLLVFTQGTPGGSLPMGWRVAVVLATVCLAALTFRLVEDPLRHHRLLVTRPSRSLSFGVALTVLAAMSAVAVTAPRALHAGVTAPRADVGSLAHLIDRPVQGVPENLRPSLVESRKARTRLYSDGCHQNYFETSVEGCVYGDPESKTTVVLYGDSHAAHWFPAINKIAVDRGWRLLSMTKSLCSASTGPAYHPALGRDYPECEEWRENVLARIEAERTTLVILANHIQGSRQGQPLDAWLEGLSSTMSRILEAGSEAVVFGPTPTMATDPPTCLSGHIQQASACGRKLSEAVDPGMQAQLRSTVAGAGGRYIDTLGFLCNEDHCPAMAGDVLIYRDANHLTPDFVKLLVPHLGRTLDGVIRDPRNTARAGEAA